MGYKSFSGHVPFGVIGVIGDSDLLNTPLYFKTKNPSQKKGQVLILAVLRTILSYLLLKPLLIFSISLVEEGASVN